MRTAEIILNFIKLILLLNAEEQEKLLCLTKGILISKSILMRKVK
jgi:hypothetical protein